jgi:hypothetical protein
VTDSTESDGGQLDRGESAQTTDRSEQAPDGLGRRLALGVGVVAVVGLLVSFAGVDWGGVLAELRAADPVPILLALAAVAMGQVLWGLATGELVGAVRPDFRAHRAVTPYLIGTFLKQVLPFGHAGGVPLLAYVVSDRLDVEYRPTLAAVTASELVVLLASLTVAAVGVAGVATAAGVDPVAAGTPFFVLVAVAGAGVRLRGALVRGGAATAAAVGRVTLGRLVPSLRGRLEPAAVDRAVGEYLAALDRAAADRAALARAGGYALLGWLAFSVPLVLSFDAVGASLPLPLAFLLVPAGGLATLLPTPGGLGGAEVGTAAAVVVATGLPLEVTAAGVVCYRVATYWFPVVGCGLVAGAVAVRTGSLPRFRPE